MAAVQPPSLFLCTLTNKADLIECQKCLRLSRQIFPRSKTVHLTSIFKFVYNNLIFVPRLQCPICKKIIPRRQKLYHADDIFLAMVLVIDLFY